MRPGKFPPELLERLLGKIGISDHRVLLGPRLGEDAAMLDYGDRVLVAKTDPVTLASSNAGWYAVHVNANDVACVGATPRWFLATVLVPPSLPEQEAEALFDQMLEACKSLEVTLIGGHSEVTSGIQRPIVVGCMLGEAQKGKTVTTSGAMPRDSIVLTKGIAIEGTALVAQDMPQEPESDGLDEKTLEEARQLLFYPGISVVKDALTACAAVPVHSMHDPTEGGLATGLWELAVAAGVGIVVEVEGVPVFPQCARICEILGLDPLGLLASGALLITIPPEETPRLLAALQEQGIQAGEIGRVVPPDQGVTMVREGRSMPLPKYQRDELARYLDR